MDLKSGYDFDRLEDRNKAWEMMETDEPMLVVGSPPCTLFSVLMELNKHMYGNNEEWMARFHANLEKAKRYVIFCTKIYMHQRSKGRYFLHEHPWLAKSWLLDCMMSLEKLRDVIKVRGDQCQYGLTTKVGGGSNEVGPALKPTGFLTNSPYLATELSRRCAGNHTHIPLMSGRAAAAAEYPDGLCRAICVGLQKQKRHDMGRKVTSLAMTPQRLSSIGMACCEATGIEMNSIHLEGYNDHEHVGHGGVAQTRVVHRPVGGWSKTWIDTVHEDDGHSWMG